MLRRLTELLDRPWRAPEMLGPRWACREVTQLLSQPVKSAILGAAEDVPPEYVTLADLEPFAITLDDILNLPRQPTRSTALDGGPCWSLTELSELLGWKVEGEEP